MTLSVVNRPKAPISNRPEIGVVNIALEVKGVLETIEVRMVERIEHLSAKLDVVFLSHFKVLVDGKIQIIDRLTSDGALPETPKFPDAG